MAGSSLGGSVACWGGRGSAVSWDAAVWRRIQLACPVFLDFLGFSSLPKEGPREGVRPSRRALLRKRGGGRGP